LSNTIFAAAIIFYDDVKGMKRALDSLTEGFDRIFCLDGKFKDFPTTEPLSTDGSREVVQSFTNTILMDCPNVSEIEKRSKYLELCGEYDVTYLCILDSDEYIVKADWEKFRINCQVIANKINRDSSSSGISSSDYTSYHVFGIRMEYADGPDQFDKPYFTPATGVYPRLWYKPYEMMYRNTHYGFVPKDPRNPFHREQTETWNTEIYGITMRHDPYYTRVDPKRESASSKYKELLQKHEGSI